MFGWVNLKAEEEVRALQKKIQQVENELDQVQEQLTAANVKLEEKDKALQNVSHKCHFLILLYMTNKWSRCFTL